MGAQVVVDTLQEKSSVSGNMATINTACHEKAVAVTNLEKAVRKVKATPWNEYRASHYEDMCRSIYSYDYTL